MRDYKLVVLGAGGVGKSCLTVQFVQGVYMDAYDPTIEDSYNKEVEVDGRACNLEILDTAGVAQFTAMRELYIKNGQGFLLVYSVTDSKSLQELLAIKEQIFRIKGTSNVPMVLIGNKCDLTDERQLQPEDGIEVSKTWDKIPFYETSAMYRMNVDDAFIDIVRQIIRKEVNQQQQIDNKNSNNDGTAVFKSTSRGGESQTQLTEQDALPSQLNENLNSQQNSKHNVSKNTPSNNSPVEKKASVATQKATTTSNSKRVSQQKPKKSKKKCIIL